MSRFLRVNMATKTCVCEDIPEEYAGLGGRALTSTIVAREVNPICTPLGPHNKLVFAPGLLGATNSPNGNRISVGCKSPLTEGIKESNSGGQPGGHLAKLGIMAIIVEDMATEGEWWQLELSKDSAKLVPSTVAGLNNFDAVAKLVETYGDKCSYVTIGRAGEFKLTAASIAFTDRELRPMRHAGRGGVGAGMGSKGLKAIIINPEGGKNHPLADEKAFREASKRFAKALTEHPITGKGLAEYGTGVLVNILHEAGGLPTANFTVGQFDKHEGVSGETMNRLTKERGGEGAVAHGCMSGCIIRCSGLFPDKQGKFQSKWPEYETLWSFGPHSGISDIDDNGIVPRSHSLRPTGKRLGAHGRAQKHNPDGKGDTAAHHARHRGDGGSERDGDGRAEDERHVVQHALVGEHRTQIGGRLAQTARADEVGPPGAGHGLGAWEEPHQQRPYEQGPYRPVQRHVRNQNNKAQKRHGRGRGHHGRLAALVDALRHPRRHHEDGQRNERGGQPCREKRVTRQRDHRDHADIQHAAEKAHEQTRDIEGVRLAHAQHFLVDPRTDRRHVPPPSSSRSHVVLPRVARRRR